MRDQQVNTFNKGMSQDLGKTLPQEGTYLNGLNIRIVANEDDSESGILVNVDGNELSFELDAPCGDMAPCQQGWVEGGQLYFTEGMSIEEGQLIVVEGLIHYVHTSADNVTLADLTECPEPPPPPVYGCTDPTATNYNPLATVNDGTCIPEPVYGCMDQSALNYDSDATLNEVSETDPSDPCIYPIQGCMDEGNAYYNPLATFEEEGDCLCCCGPYTYNKSAGIGYATAGFVFGTSGTSYNLKHYYITNTGYITMPITHASAEGYENSFWDLSGETGVEPLNLSIQELNEHEPYFGENYYGIAPGAAYVGEHEYYSELSCDCDDDNATPIYYWFHPLDWEFEDDDIGDDVRRMQRKGDLRDGEYVPQENCSKYTVVCGEAIPTSDRVISAEEYLLPYFTGTNASLIEVHSIPTQEEIDSVGNLCPVEIIGWTTIRDDLYLFATNNQSFNPGGVLSGAEIDPPSAGYIFKVEFDLTTNLVTEYSLVYAHSELNFSTRHPIEAVGRFETNTVQRLYWTDNYNEVRTINVKEENIFHLVPDDLKLIPFSFFSVPKIVAVTDGGKLPAGVYQYAYRLRNEGGAETRFSAFTGLAHVVEASEDAPYWNFTDDPEDVTEYVGTDPTVICEKTVELRIDNIDTSYDKIEIAAIHRTTQEGISSSYIFESKKINSDTMTFKHASHTDIVGLISLVELTAFSLNIERAKTVETKDNRLFLGNVITPDIRPFDKFNARAYRFRRSDLSAWAGDEGHPTETYADFDFDPKARYVKVTSSYPSQGFQYTLQHNLDAINPFNEFLNSPEEPESRYKYQKDGRTIGGEGPNVKYEFIKKELDGDIYVSSDKPTSPPFVSVKELKKDCIEVDEFWDYKKPVVAANYKGYQRDEIYRFGIVLYDKQGNPGAVNWIGDIRFPKFYDFDWKGGAGLYSFTLSQTRATDNTQGLPPYGSYTAAEQYSDVPYFLTGSQSGSQIQQDQFGFLNYQDQYTSAGDIIADSSTGFQYGEIFANYGELGIQISYDARVDKHSMYALGIKFTIQLPPDIIPEISGYSMVRAERTKRDKTVLGVGLGHWMYSFAPKAADSAMGDPSKVRVAFNGRMAQFDDHPDWIETKYGQMQHNIMSMDCPDFLITGKYPSLSECDYIEYIGNLHSGGSANAYVMTLLQDKMIIFIENTMGI